MNLTEMKKNAAELLICSTDTLEETTIPDLNAVYYRNTDRGGAALIISEDGGMLMADPFYTEFEEHIKQFMDGKRSILPRR